MKTIRWGMIGTGDVSEVKSGPAFRKIEGSDLVAVANRSPEKAESYAQRHNIARWHRDSMDLIHDPGVDMVYVATPPDAHPDYALACIRAGKPVYLEKPMARTHEECLVINEAAGKAGIAVYVAYYRRSLPYFLKLKEILESGILGKIRHVSAEQFFPPRQEDLDPDKLPWRLLPEISGGGYFHDMGCHALDIIFYLFGNPLRVEGMSSNKGGLYEADDHAEAMIALPGELAFKGSWDFVAPASKDRIEVEGSRGRLYFSVFSFEPVILELEQGRESYSFDRPAHIQQPLIQSIVDEQQGRGSCPSTGRSAAITSHVMDQICM